MAKRSYLKLDQIANLPASQVKEEWARRYGTPAPNIAADLLRLGLGYKMQEQRVGGLSRSARSLLRHSGDALDQDTGKVTLPRKLTPGTRLVRDWHGVGHTVVVLDRGFGYDGKHWKSLTAIAKAITGTHWNGPLFFGLVGRRK